MSEKYKVMLSVHELISEISSTNEVFIDRYVFSESFPKKDVAILNLIITEEFITRLDTNLLENLKGRTLKELMNAKGEGRKSSMVGDREALAKCLAQEGGRTIIQNAYTAFSDIFRKECIHDKFPLSKVKGIYNMLLKEPISPTAWIRPNSNSNVIHKNQQIEKELGRI